MKKLLIIFMLVFIGIAYGVNEPKGAIEFETNIDIYGRAQIEAIKNWGMDTNVAGVIETSVLLGEGGSIDPLNRGEKIKGIRGWNGLGELFTILQEKYFALIFLLIIIFVPMAFYGHYKIIGKRHYAHNSFLIVFTRYNIIVHWCTALPFMVLCLSGLMMIFGDKLGGGWPIRFARDVHGFATLFFIVFGTLMFLMWVKDCLFRGYDMAWLFILGGYLDKVNREIPAHKFNAGQKMWFWVATLGGAVMAFTGGVMYFQYTDVNTLRLMAMVHNIMGFVVIALLITHIYMAVFAIEGALESILNGKMGEEEVSMLHSLYYKDLQTQGKLDNMRLMH